MSVMKAEWPAQVRFVADWIEAAMAIPGSDPDHILNAVEVSHGARLRFVHGTNELRMLGVVATCTSTKRGLLNGWVRAARRAINSAEGA